MKYNKIILAGGNGYLGNVLAKYYQDKAEEVVILSRHEKQAEQNIRTVVWDGKTHGKWTAELVNADMLINLCGKNVNCRYTEKNKAEIIASRVLPTELLGMVIHDMAEPPKLWINVTSAYTATPKTSHKTKKPVRQAMVFLSMYVINGKLFLINMKRPKPAR